MDKRPQLLSYIPSLDGIRALSVIAVIIYHANKLWLPGGFLGVSVFVLPLILLGPFGGKFVQRVGQYRAGGLNHWKLSG